MDDRLRSLWDFDDLDATEQRLREQLAAETGSGGAEVLTQLARIEGLRGDFDEGERLIEEAEAIRGPLSMLHASPSVRLCVRSVARRRRCRSSSKPSRARLPFHVP